MPTHTGKILNRLKRNFRGQMTKEQALSKLGEFVKDLDYTAKKEKAGNTERLALIKRLNSDIVFIYNHKLSEKIMLLIIKEVKPQVDKLTYKTE